MHQCGRTAVRGTDVSQFCGHRAWISLSSNDEPPRTHRVCWVSNGRNTDSGVLKVKHVKHHHQPRPNRRIQKKKPEKKSSRMKLNAGRRTMVYIHRDWRHKYDSRHALGYPTQLPPTPPPGCDLVCVFFTLNRSFYPSTSGSRVGLAVRVAFPAFLPNYRYISTTGVRPK